MKNSEKTELKREVIELSKGFVEKKEAMRILVGYGYFKGTVSKYWDIFAKNKDEVKE